MRACKVKHFVRINCLFDFTWKTSFPLNHLIIKSLYYLVTVTYTRTLLTKIFTFKRKVSFLDAFQSFPCNTGQASLCIMFTFWGKERTYTGKLSQRTKENAMNRSNTWSRKSPYHTFSRVVDLYLTPLERNWDPDPIPKNRIRMSPSRKTGSRSFPFNLFNDNCCKTIAFISINFRRIWMFKPHSDPQSWYLLKNTFVLNLWNAFWERKDL